MSISRLHGLAKQVLSQVEADGLTVLSVLIDTDKLNYKEFNKTDYWFKENSDSLTEEMPINKTSINYKRLVYLSIDGIRIPASLTSYYSDSNELFLKIKIV